jgi:hypothetical protein
MSLSFIAFTGGKRFNGRSRSPDVASGSEYGVLVRAAAPLNEASFIISHSERVIAGVAWRAGRPQRTRTAPLDREHAHTPVPVALPGPRVVPK